MALLGNPAEIRTPLSWREGLMPQIVLFIAGAGLLAGARWIVREIQSRAAEAEHAAAEAHRRASEAAMGPKDLGSLEWDAEASVYRPVRRG